MPWVTPNVEDCEHDDSVGFCEEVEGVREAAKEDAPNLTSNPPKPPRRLRHPAQSGIHLVLQLQSEAGPARFVPRNRFREFVPGERTEADVRRHPRGA